MSSWHKQGTIRQNLDPMERHTERDMIRVLKDVGLWEILCGISLSHAKEEEESPRYGPSRQATSAFMDVSEQTSTIRQSCLSSYCLLG